jgi:hypothetical protein
MTCNEFRQTLGEEASPNRQLRAAQSDDFHLVPKLRFGKRLRETLFRLRCAKRSFPIQAFPNGSLGTRKRLIFLCLTGVIQEIKSSDQIPKTTLFLEPRGKFTIQVGVNSSEATGLKKGDTVS